MGVSVFKLERECNRENNVIVPPNNCLYEYLSNKGTTGPYGPRNRQRFNSENGEIDLDTLENIEKGLKTKDTLTII